MYIKNFFKLRDLRLFATDIFWPNWTLSCFDFIWLFFLKNLTLLFLRLKGIRRKLNFKEK